MNAVARRAFGLTLRLFPADFRRAYGAEMRADFAAELERRGNTAGGRPVVFALRAVLDAARQGWRERTRRGPLPGHGSHTPGNGRRGGMFEGLATDLRLGARALRRAPGFTAAAVAVLALGIGANTTVFSALKMAILSPPPYPQAERLVMADLSYGRRGEGEAELMPWWSYPKFQAYVERADRLVDPVAGYGRRSVTLTDAGDPARLPVELVSPGYFQVLGQTPAVGRFFGAEEADASAPSQVAVLSYGLWRERFGSESSVVGRRLTLNGQSYQVVGVAPRGFTGLTGGAELWVPMATGGQLFSRFMVTGAQAHWLNVVGRLRPDVTFEAAAEQMESIGQAVAETFPSDDPNEVYGAGLRRFTDVRRNANARAAVVLLSAAAFLVLLVACANLSGLLLARAKHRARDGAVRLAVGASRWRLVRAALVESGVLALTGGTAGVFVAVWGTRAMAAVWPARFLSSGEGEMRVMDLDALGLDGTVLGYALLVTFATAFLFGLAPALRASRGDVVGHLKESGRSTARARRVLGLDGRGALVGAQVALALVLLVGAGLVGGSTRRLLSVDEGIAVDDMLLVQYAIPRTDAWYADASTFHARFLERVAALPGVEGVTLGTPPLGGHWSTTRVSDIEGRPPIPQGEGPRIGVHEVADGHFETLGIPLLRGRSLDERDGTDAQPSLVISRTAAAELFPGEDPVGRRIRIGFTADGKDPYAEIVGVVGDVLYDRPDEPIMPEAYFSFREFRSAETTVMVTASGDPMALLPAVREALKELDPQLAIFGVTTLADERAAAIGDRRVILALLTLFAAVTVLLAATGTWGIVAFAVADRRRELGLRMALGSDAGAVVRMVVGRSLASALPGLALGLAGAWAASRLLETFLFQTSPRDPVTYAAGAALLAAVVLLASWLPARRATRVDPSEALRAD